MEPRRRHRSRPLEIAGPVAALLLSFTGTASSASGDGTVPTLAALRIEEPIVVDGLLDDEAWRRAEIGGGFVQREPDVGAPATERTEVRVAFTDRTLYVAIRAFDSRAGELAAKALGRDLPLAGDDSVSILLDTFLDHRNAYVFSTNPLGSRNDSLITDELRNDSRWDGIWRVACRRDAEGWSAELAVPFSILRFDPQHDVWGFQVQRHLRRRNESSLWSPLRRDEPFIRVSRAGRLKGLSGLRPPRDLRLKPFLTADASRHRDDDGARDREHGLDGGLDLKWGLGRGLTLDLTVNTDFAETEADEQQVNLTRFSLFLPEKRGFFQEHAGIFAFGPNLGSRFHLFFSRRIGIDGGRPVPVDFGARLAGRQGPWSLGLLGAATGELDDVPANRWGVVRLKRNVGERSYVGILAGNRRGADGTRNTTWGVDGAFKPSRRLELWSFFAGTSGAPESDGAAFGVGADFRADTWRWTARSLWLEDTFDPQIGFVQRGGSRADSFDAGWTPRPGWSGIRHLDFTFRATSYTALDGEQETVDAALDLFALRWSSGARLALFTQYRYENLREPFDIFDGVALSAGSYRWNDFGIALRGAEDAPWSLRGFVIGGDFYGGRRLASNLTLQWRPSARWALRTQWNRNDIELPAGSFETNVWRQRVRVAWSPDLESSLFLQYSDAAELTALNLRLAWHFRPGSDLFVVYDETWDSPTFAQRLNKERRLAIKVSYTFGL